ncbi:hypothetical protein JMY81_23535 [Brenneria goodwinii]|uniref:hypothetical protein n=1 Tax=Brenneria goodwinii TaxID=1109412 RepID=UPI000EF19D8A|nr:hypothetical protein [Brenneria goodwinii]MCG8159126.1 hypothetical protein [Brenneria goodwinii]MCG8163761.1 hypothetical protein [Brenneria goodwinii]MCG8168356.1 hypothetical protein [Brenneria goodwinii]MCG8173006.1 hypothetical protein [Brenneria goodwinii]MCG8177636.1 hypothetical protein [Brenneria goodwinii]
MKFINWLMLLGIAPLAACAPKRDLTLSPPENTQWVDIEVVAPPNTTAFPLNALYRSSVCLHERRQADMSKVKSRGYNPVHMALQPDAGGRVYRQRVAVDGGGPCEWKLSMITLGIKYSRTDHLVKNAEVGPGSGLKVAFDSEASNNGYYEPVRNELAYSAVYYPFLIEHYLGESKRELWIYGEQDFRQYLMKINEGRVGKIIFLPKLDEKKIVTWQGVKKMNAGEKSKITYPDGSVAFGKTDPDYNKLKNMK